MIQQFLFIFVPLPFRQIPLPIANEREIYVFHLLVSLLLFKAVMENLWKKRGNDEQVFDPYIFYCICYKWKTDWMNGRNPLKVGENSSALKKL